MADLEQTVGTEITLTLKGHDYKAEKLTLGDWAEFERVAKDKHRKNIISSGREVYGDDMPASVFDAMIRPLTEAEIEQYQSSVEGITFLLWKSLSKRHKDMTLEKAADLVTLDDISTITEAIIGTSAKNAPTAEAAKD